MSVCTLSCVAHLSKFSCCWLLTNVRVVLFVHTIEWWSFSVIKTIVQGSDDKSLFHDKCSIFWVSFDCHCLLFAWCVIKMYVLSIGVAWYYLLYIYIDNLTEYPEWFRNLNFHFIGHTHISQFAEHEFRFQI